MKKRLLALTLSGLMLLSSISPANIQAYASEPSDAFSTISGNDLSANQNEETGEESEKIQESTETTNLDLNDFFDWDLSNSGFADISGNDAFLLASLVETPGVDVLKTKPEQLTKADMKLTYTAGGSVHEMTEVSGVYELPADVLPSEVEKLRMEVALAVTDTNRNLHAGDYFEVKLPSGLNIQGTPSPVECTIDSDGTVWAQTSVSGNTIQFTFTDTVEKQTEGVLTYRGMKATMNFDFNFVDLKDGDGADFVIQWSKGDIHLSVPKGADDITGIKKTGEFDKAEGLIHWTVEVGEAKDKTVSLKDYTFTDTMGANQDLVTDSVKVNGTAQTVTTEASNFSFAFGDVKAPQTVTYDTRPAAVFMMGNVADVSNTATVSSKPVKGQADGKDFTDTFAVAAPEKIIVKKGIQVSSDEMEWTITYNKEAVKVWKATVYDDLSAGLTYVEGSALFNGVAAPSGVTVSTSALDTDRQKLSIRFDNTAAASGSYDITFRTKINPSKFSGEGSSATKIENVAYVSAEFPSGSGTGPATEYSAPKVETDYSAAFIDKSVVDTDEARARRNEGYITWEIHPSTKKQNSKFYETAVVTDSLPSDQTWMPDSVNIKAKGYDLVTNGVVAASAGGQDNPCTAYDNAAHTFTFDYDKLQALGLELGDVVITVETKALNYFSEDKAHKYTNTASLSLKMADTEVAKAADNDEITFGNKMLSKDVKFVPLENPAAEPSESNRSYFIYTIKVNENRMALTNAVLTDDISHAFAAYNTDDSKYKDMEATDFAIDSSKSKVEKVAADGTKTPVATSLTYEPQKLTFDMGTTADSYEVTLYVYVTPAGVAKFHGDLADKIIRTQNVAELTADEIPAFQSNVAGGKGPEKELNNAILTKMGIQSGRSINWTVRVNLGGANLGDEVVFTDKIPEGLYLDGDSVKVTAPTFVPGKGNTPSAVAAGDTNLIGTSGITKSISRNKNGTAILKVKLPASTARTFIISYTTEGVSDATSFKNEASLDSTNINKTTFAEVNIDGDAWSSGYAVAVLKMTKVDSLSGGANVIPLAGAEYALLTADGDTALDANGDIIEDYIADIKETDAKGNALFVAKLNQNYYIAEKTAPEGYIRDKKVYGPYKATKVGLQKVSDKGIEDGYFKDVRENNDSLVADLHVTKTFDTDTTGDFRQKNNLEKTAAFTLYIYPDKGVNASSTYKRTVEFTKEADGSYKYAEQNGAAANLTELTATDSTAADLKLTDLPWGHYELVETKAAAGYLPTAKLVFEVDRTGKLNFTDSACVDAEILQASTVATGGQEKVAAVATLKNHRTQLVLKKTDMDGNAITSIESAEFTLAPAETTDALVEAEAVAGSTDTTKKLTFTGQQLSDGVTLSGLCQVGVKYTLTETKAPKGYQTMKPVTFMINDGKGKEALGTIAIVGGTRDTVAVTNPEAEDATKTATITLKNKPTAFDFQKVDQNGLGVADVVLTIIPKEGSNFAHAAGTDPVNADGNIVLTTEVNANGTAKTNTVTGEMVAGNTYIIKESYGVGFAVDADGKAVDYVDASGETTEFTVSEDGTGFAEGTLDSSVKNGSTLIFGAKYTSAAKAGENSKVTITNHRVLAQMAIAKVDADDTTKKLGSAEFKLYRQAGATPNPASATTTVEAGKDTLLTTVKTAADGTWKTETAAATVKNPVYENKALSLGLPVGTYYLVETKAPQGYQIAKEEGVARTYSFTVTNADDGKTFDTFTTTVAGESKTVSQIANARIPGSIVLTKQDANDDSKLAGAVFALYVKNGTVLTPATISTGTTAEVDGKTVPTVVTAADGKANFTNLSWGTYVVKELTAPAGYELNPLETDGTALKEITIDATTASTTEEKNEVAKTITDSKTSFKLRKIDQNGMPVVGAKLTLVEEKDAEGTATGAQVGVYTTNGTDIALEGVLKAGYSYSLTEESAAGFFVTSGKTHFTVSADGTKLENLTEDTTDKYVNLSVKLADTDKTVELTNTRYLEGFEATKVDGSDESRTLSGAEFVLYQQMGAAANPSTDLKVVVDATGSAVDTEGNPYVLTADANGKINLKDTAYADKKNGAIRDAAGKLIKDKEGNLQALSEGLGTGNYYLIETKAPEGYALDANVKYAFNITQKDAKNQVTTIQISNTRILGTLTFTSKDEKTEEVVPGVVYGLFEKSGSTWIPSTFPTGSTVTVDGKTVPTITTDANGDGKIENLPWGKEYALLEIQDSSLQPQGYVLNPAVTAEGKDKDHDDTLTPILFGTPAVTGKTNTVLHVHTDLFIQPIILDVHKVGPQNEPLAGATVKVTGNFADGTTEKTFTTEVDGVEPDGTETWNKLLKPGETYHVTEVTPAPTYGSTTDFDFVVGTDGFVTVVTDGLDAGTKAKLQKETSYGKVEDTQARHSQITVKSPQTILNFSTDVNRYEQGLQTAMQKPSTLAGIQYQVYTDEACTTKVQKDGRDVTASSDKDGKVVIPGLTAGTYYIKEIGYDTLTASAIGKPDATAEELTLAQARLWGTKLTNKVYRGVVTNNDFGGIEVKEGDTWKAVERGIIHHEVYSGEIKFTKVDKDDTSVKLADSTYGLYRSLDSYPEAIKAQAEALIAQKKLATYAYQNKTYVLLDKQVTSSEAGKEGDIVFQVPLAAEEYLIKELQAPAGHKVSADPVLVSMHLGAAPAVDGAAAITTSLKNNGNGTVTTGVNGLTWFEPRIKLQVKTLSNASPETAVGPVHLVLKDKDGNIVDEWDTTIEEYEEDGLVDKEVDVADVDDEGNPVLDAEGNPKTHKEVQQVPGKIKKQRVLDWNHTVVDTASLLKVGETYTITTTSVPAGFVPTTVSFKVNTVEVPAYTGSEFPTEFIQVERIVIGKKAAPTQRNTSSNGSGGNQGGNSKPQNPAKDTVSPDKTGKDPIVVIQDSASIIEKTFTTNGKDGKGSLFGKSRKGTSVATAGSRKESGVVKSVRRALEAAFGAISGTYRKLVAKTGDEAPIIGMIALLLIAVAGITAVLIHKRKKK